MVGAGTYALEDQGLPRRHYIICELKMEGNIRRVLILI